MPNHKKEPQLRVFFQPLAMTTEQLKHILKTGAAELGVAIGDKETSLFLIYLAELKEWNKKINLTSITEGRDIIIRHFLDSLILAPFFAGKETLLDIGSGAGFPGIPLKLVLPDLKIMLMDSVNKKAVFMRHIIRMLGLRDIEAVQGRAEDTAVIKKFGSSFDVVASRAFAELGRFLEIAMPYAKNGGMVLAVKGPKGVEELKRLPTIKNIESIQAKEIKLPFSDITTTILSFKKTMF
ncbi:MAG: 16S rRNA (guanine(527)-N(7))-methyltransferase RsmG [Deltaproteobacteria bacterium]|nr:16S rRNA (guanine(527)-N(7))-methyltransferase RsmG [Deltaproteobacteria bacterium]